MTQTSLPCTATESEITPAEQCFDMPHLRAAIDALDEKLVVLLALRQRYIERAAEIKVQRAAIRDEARIADVLAKVMAAAARSNLAPDIARAVWSTLMERSIALELARFEALQRCK